MDDLRGGIVLTTVDLPALRRRWMVVSIVVSTLAVLLVTLYIGSLLQLSASQWQSFGGFVALAFVLCTFPYQWQGMKALEPVCLALRHALDTDVDPVPKLATAEASKWAFDGLKAGLGAPLRIASVGLVWWALGGGIVVVGVGLLHPELRGYGLSVMYASTISAAFVAVTMHFLLAKRVLRDALASLTALVPDPDQRERAASTLALSAKLRLTVLGVVVGSVVFAAFLAQRRSGDPLEAAEARHQLHFLELVSERLLERPVVEIGGGDEIVVAPPIEDPVPGSFESLTREARALGLARDLVLLDARGQRVLAGPEDRLAVVELESIRRAQTRRGDGFDVFSPNVFAWVRLPEGRGILVAATPWEEVAPTTQRLTRSFALLTLASVGLGLLLTQLLAGDAGFAIGRLREWSRRVAAGDLQSGAPLESEDEFGALARDFERMVADLRRLIEDVSGAVAGVEGSAADLDGLSGDVMQATRDQVEAIGSTRGAVDDASRGIDAIAGSADELASAIEESNTSILELNATGEALNATAATLAGHADEVASSVEQTAIGVQRIVDSTEELSTAAEETGSSMEQIERSLQSVSQYAEENAATSQSVADAAERGRERVLETAAGMEAIRGSSAAARQVVQTLDRRALEIGNVLKVIEDIADGTQLLALNAAIIASQAGEAGRAFSVVAEETRMLADRVLGSAKEIGILIEALQAESRNALETIEEGADSVERGVALSQEAGKSLGEITEFARQSGRRAEEIVGAVAEQTRAATHVREQMERVRSGVSKIRETSAEQRSGNEILRQASRSMRDVARRTQQTTEEQARGISQISHSIESVRASIELIHGALRDQSRAMENASTSLSRIEDRTQTHSDTSAALGGTVHHLLERAGSLRATLSRFRL
jgi:methyl-accepting chemotaxis protein